jgi:hypothetical protein
VAVPRKRTALLELALRLLKTAEWQFRLRSGQGECDEKQESKQRAHKGQELEAGQISREKTAAYQLQLHEYKAAIQHAVGRIGVLQSQWQFRLRTRMAGVFVAPSAS